jgi:ankyrin repeat protein
MSTCLHLSMLSSDYPGQFIHMFVMKVLIFSICLAFISFTSASFENEPLLDASKSKIPTLYESVFSFVFGEMSLGSDYSPIYQMFEFQMKIPLLPDGSNILHFASKKRIVDLMRISIDSGQFDINAADDRLKVTALHYVCQGTENHEMAVEAAKLLVENGANIDALDARNHTPLHYAIQNSNVELVEYLLSVGARTEFQNSILAYAMINDSAPAAMKALIENNPRLLDTAKGFLHFASRKRALDLMRIAIDSGQFDINEVEIGDGFRFTALHCLCQGTENPEMAVDAAKLLVESGAYIDALDYRDHTPLHSVVQTSNIELVEYLLSVGARTEFQYSILNSAMENHADIHIMKALIYSNPYLLDSAERILHFASQERAFDLMRIVIASGKFDVNAVHDRWKITALHFLCQGTRNPEMAVDAAKLLVQNGANIDALDALNFTPLHYAIQNSNVELVEYLLSLGVRTEFDQSILNFAIRCNADPSIMKALIANNPLLLDTLPCASHFRMVNLLKTGIATGRFNIQEVDEKYKNFTALHYVCHGTENPEMAVEAAKLLVESGANIDTLDCYNSEFKC